MTDFFQGFLEGMRATSPLEWIAVLTAVVYVILAAKQSILCWPFALISSSIYVYLCHAANLFIESYLQIFYVLMGIVGWLAWGKTKSEKLFVRRWTPKYHLINIVLSLLVAISLGYFFKIYTEQANPYMDAFTTIFSLAATFMVTQKVLNTWLYWIVIDAVSIYLYGSRALHLSAVLYFLFTFLAIFAWFQWRKQLKLQSL